MNTPSLFRRAALAAACCAPLLAQASVLQTLGIGSAIPLAVPVSASFTANLSLANPFSEGGLVFSHTGFANDNGGCGYAGIACEANPGDGFSQAFSGNYYATAGTNAYVSISSGATPMSAIEFAADSGYLTVNLMWETWLAGSRTATGRVSLGAGGVGGVVGLLDTAGTGFDEVRVFAFDSPSDLTGYSTAAIDTVRVSPVPEAQTWALLSTGLALLGIALRRQRRD